MAKWHIRAKTRLARLFVDRFGRRDALFPIVSRVNVHLDDARIRRDADHVEALIGWWGVSFLTFPHHLRMRSATSFS